MRNDILRLEDLSKAVSDDPVRNDILRLDEMMSEASWIDSYRVAIYFIVFVIVYLITDCRCDSEEIPRDTTWFVVVASRFIASRRPG